MKKALVTGANGFIGSWLVHKLNDEKISVIAVVKNKESNISSICNLPYVKIVYCDLSEIKNLHKRISDKDIDVFYHLAWRGSTGQERGDYEIQLSNAKYTLDAIHLAASLGCKRFVGAGTLAEIDCNAYILEDGSTPLPVTCYGSAKIAAHFMSKAECNRLGIGHIWAYISNTYGEGNRTSNFINFASNLMLTGERASFTTGEQLYDFVHVSDAAKALYLLGEKGKSNYSYYIGSGKPRPLKEFIYMIRDAIDKSIPIYLGEVKYNGIKQPASIFDCSKLIRDTGYIPQVDFQEGIITTLEWLKRERRINDSKL